MQIYGSLHVHGPQSMQGPHRAAATPTTAAAAYATRGADQLDISPQAELLSRVRDIPEIRVDRVMELREAIESGEYETPEKIDLALERLLDEIA